MSEIYIGRSADFEPGSRRVVAIGKIEVGVFRLLDETFVAYENACSHQGGPVCQGKITARVVERLSDDKRSLGLCFDEGEPHLVCPWHGYEYALSSGRHAADPRPRLRPIPVSVSEGNVYVNV